LGNGQSSPALGAEGTVYVGSYNNKVYAVNPQVPQVLWTFTTGGAVHSSPAIGVDGTVYVGSGDGRLYALAGATGQKRWDYETGGAVGSSPAVAADGTVYVGSADGRLYALESDTGRKLWDFPTGSSILSSSPAIGTDGTVYVGVTDGTLYAVRGSSSLAPSPWPKFRGDARNTGRVSPPGPLRLVIAVEEGRVRITWMGTGVLQASDALGPGDWRDVSDATSPYDVEPVSVQRFYRLRRPRRVRCGQTGSGPREAF